MRILIENKLKNLVNVNILKNNLKNYEVISKLGNRYVYRKLKKITSVFNKSQVTKGSAGSGRKYIVFRFKMYRMKLDANNLHKAVKKMRVKYNSVKTKNRNYIAQRLGIMITTKIKSNEKRLNKWTNRMKTFELNDLLSTYNFSRDKSTTESMFKYFEDMIYKYLNNEINSPSVLENNDYSIKYFNSLDL